MKAKFLSKSIPVIGLLLLAKTSWADVLPGAALPEQVGKALTPRAAPPTTALPPVVAPEKKAPSALMEQAKKIKFTLNRIVLEGNHVYSEKDLLPLYQRQLHKVITVADLFQIVQSITNYYRNNGYILSRAILPPQHVKNGIVHVRIIEGYIGKVDVTGNNPRGASCQVLEFGKKIKACPPLEISRMERYLLLANDLPGTSVRAVLSPSKKQTGAADLTLVTQQSAVGGYLSYDNYGTRYIGPQQMSANLKLNSLIASGDMAQATITKTPKGGELTFTDVNYNMPWGAEGTRWLLGGQRTQTHPLFVLQPLEIDGVTNNYYTTVQYPWIRSRAKNLNVRVGFNYLDSHVTTIPNATNLYTDHLRNLDLGGTYNFADSWYGANLISADLRQGLPIWGYTNSTNPATAKTSHPGGRGDYTKLLVQLSRLQAIKGPWSLYGVLDGQWAFNPLLASEQFTFGGSQLGRGYDVAELIGDRGASASLELRYDLGIGRFLLQGLQLYTFYDAGEIWNIQNIAGTLRKVSATSAGLGTRFFFTKYVSGNLMWAQPLTKPVAALQAENQVTVGGITQNRGNGNAPRVFFSVVASLD